MSAPPHDLGPVSADRETIASASRPTAADARDHVAQLYESDDFLLDALARFVRSGLDAGDTVFVIATGAHRAALEARSHVDGPDLDAARNASRYVALDGRETLNRISVDGWPDADRFADVIGARITQAGRTGGVRVYAEMVALLSSDGRREAALHLEELWNGLARVSSLSLLSGYSMVAVGGAGDATSFEDRFDAHGGTLPVATYGAREEADDRVRVIAALQRKARALENEVAQRREVERTLRGRNDMLQALVHASPVPIVVIERDTTVRLWNAAAERAFGWTEAEVLGRPIPVVPIDRREECVYVSDGVAHGESVVGARTTRLRRDGSPIDVVISAAPLADASGTVSEIVLLFEDVTLRTRAERARKKALHELATLAETGRVLSAELDLERLLQTVTDAARQLSGAAYAAFFSGEDDELYTVSGATRAEVTRLGTLRDAPLVAATFAGDPVIRRDDVRADPRYEAASSGGGTPFRSLPVASYLAVPVVGRAGAIFGGLFLAHAQPRAFGIETERVVTGLASQAAIAIQNARLYEAERRARAAAEAGRRAAAFLAEAGTTLAASLDYGTTLQGLANLVVARIGDVCLVEVIEPDGIVRRVGATRHIGSAADALAERVGAMAPEPALMPASGARSVLVRNACTPSTAHAAQAEIMRRLAVGSYVAAPLIAGGRMLGVVAIGAEAPGRYDETHLALVEDLAHRTALAIDNARLYADVQHASSLRDEFLATISHELRTPLSVIMNWVNTLRQGKLGPERIARALDVLRRAGDTQAQLIDDILDASRAVGGRLRVELRPVLLHDVIPDALEAIRPAAEAKGVRFDVQTATPVPQVAGDAARLQQVVWNLLSNAVKFTPRGGCVSLRLERDGAEARIVVSDTGIGIDRSFLPYVFDRFRQGESVDGRRHGGLGLGLAIVKYLVEAHGGRVAASSAGRDQGAEFVVALPLAPLAPLGGPGDPPA